MRKILILGMLLPLLSSAQENNTLPKVFQGEQPDLPALRLKIQAAEAFQTLKVPDNSSWQNYGDDIKGKIISSAGVIIDHDLPIDYLETSSMQMDGYTIKNIRFQTRKDVYTTATLFVPIGDGKFPAVITTHGHWDGGRRSEVFQSIGHSLAKNGYVCLILDSWGAGERTSEHEVHEYHGSNLGASLMNVGESLLGMQLTDNIRGVDLLSSLPYVDKNNIGATGASGGGNQAMWLAALDGRITATVPVVSVGTFQSYILNSNCVCELLPSGLTFTEEAAVLGLIAPRALKIFSAFKEANQAFTPTQMFRSYHPLSELYGHMDARNKLSYQIFDTGHGYWPEMREAMIGWFDQQLKNIGDGAPKKETPFELLTIESLATYPKGKRDPKVFSTADFNRKRGNELHESMMRKQQISVKEERDRLSSMLGTQELNEIDTIYNYGMEDGWEKLAIKSTSGELIPLLRRLPKQGNDFVMLIHSEGKSRIPQDHLDRLINEGKGIVIADLWGTGERSSAEAIKIDGALPAFHTLSRSLIWFGTSVIAKWIDDIEIINKLIGKAGPLHVTIDAFKEAGVAAILMNVISDDQTKASIEDIITYDSPYSYKFDQREGVDYYNMAIHIPGFLRWGDISLAVALADAPVTFVNTRSMSGNIPSAKQLLSIKREFEFFEDRAHKKNKTEFIIR